MRLHQFNSRTPSINWEEEGAEVKAFVDGLYNQWSKQIPSVNLYGRPGATYSERTTSFLSLRELPEGALFDKKGPFIGLKEGRDEEKMITLLIGLSYTMPYRLLVETAVGLRDATTSGSPARDYLPSIIERLPLPDFAAEERATLIRATEECVRLHQELADSQETSATWNVVGTLTDGRGLTTFTRRRFTVWLEAMRDIYTAASSIQDIACKGFWISAEEKATCRRSRRKREQGG